MVYLSFKLRKVEYGHYGEPNWPFLKMEVRNLKVYQKEDELIDKVGSFGAIHTPVDEIKIITINISSNDKLFFPLGFNLDPNFTFKISVDRNPEWLCAINRCTDNNVGLSNGLPNVYETWLDFARYGKVCNLIEHPFLDESIEEVKEIRKLLSNSISKKSIDNILKIKEIIRSVENSQTFLDYKKIIKNLQLIDLQDKLEKSEERFEDLEEEIMIEREANNEMLKNLKVFNEEKLKHYLEEKNQRIEFLEKLLEKTLNKEFDQLAEKLDCLVEK